MEATELSTLIEAQFKQTTVLEWFGVITAFLCIYLAAKEHISNWPVSIVSCVAYAVLYYRFKLYGDTVLQVYFILTAVYGWYYWIKRRDEQEKPVVVLSWKGWIYTLIAIAVLTLVLSLFLKQFTNTDVPYADGFCTSVSFVAQFLMTRKVLQNWVLWILVNICYVPLLLYKGLALSAILYVALLFLAVLGYRDWKRTWKLAQ